MGMLPAHEGMLMRGATTDSRRVESVVSSEQLGRQAGGRSEDRYERAQGKREGD